MNPKFKKKLEHIPKAIDSVLARIKDWESDIKIRDKNIEAANIEQPSLIAYYDQVAVELHSMVKYLDMVEKEIRGSRMRTIKENMQRDYSDTAIQRLIDSDPEYIEVHALLIEVEEVYESVKSIVKSFEQRSYSLNNIVRIREKELENITIRMD